MKKAIPTLIGLAVLLAVALGGNALMAARSEAVATAADTGDPAARILPVRTARLVPTSSLRMPRSFTGEIQAGRSTELSFESSGRISEVLVDEGSVVAQGDVLARLDTDQLRAGRAEVEARRAGLEARLAELLEGPRPESIEAARAARAAIEERLRLAIIQRDRRTELAERGTISSEQLDESGAQVKSLTAEVAAAEARLAELENGTRKEAVDAQRGALEELDAALNSIDVQISKTELVAPFDGTVAARYLDEGTVVSVQMPSPAFHLVETRAMEARIGVPAEMVADVLASPEPRLTVRGRDVVVQGARALPTVSEATRTVPVILDLVADDRSSKPPGTAVRIGDVAVLEIDTVRQEQGAWVPLGALRESTRGLWSVFALQPGAGPEDPATAERVELEVLTTREGEAFVRGTFDGAMEIVTSGAGRLVPGQAIRPVAKGETLPEEARRR